MCLECEDMFAIKLKRNVHIQSSVNASNTSSPLRRSITTWPTCKISFCWGKEMFSKWVVRQGMLVRRALAWTEMNQYNKSDQWEISHNVMRTASHSITRFSHFILHHNKTRRWALSEGSRTSLSRLD